ncbi:MAG: hypothetical protein IJ917_05105 [Firmicutes bacterium]|nr:hypothetical protein [Bacillota bacterium]
MKYATAFLTTAEIALYFGFAMLFPAFSAYYPIVLLFLALAFCSMILAETMQKYVMVRAFPVLITLTVLIRLPRSAEILLFLPPFLYLLFTAVLGRFHRAYWQCAQTAKGLFALATAFTLIALILTPISMHTVVLITIFFLTCIFGLRMLRLHTSGSAQWLMYSLVDLLPLPAAGFAAVGVIMLFTWGKKLIEILLTPLALLISLIPMAIERLFRWMRPLEEKIEESSSQVESIAEEAAAALENAEETKPVRDVLHLEIDWRLVFILAFIAAAVLIIVLIFRKRQEEQTDTADGITGGKSFRRDRRRRKTVAPGSPAERIRKCYRAYLRLQYQHGLERVPGDTSLDILKFSEETQSIEAEERLRQLYIKARYRGNAEKEEALEAERILEMLSKQGRIRNQDSGLNISIVDDIIDSNDAV